MWRALARLTHWDWLIVGAGLMIIALLQVWPMGNSAPGTPVADTRRPDAPAAPAMSPASRDAFVAWQRDSGYFAAFAVSQDGAAWGWSSSHNTLAAAEANAIAYCADQGTGCRVVERMLPAADRTDVLGASHIDAMLSEFRTQQRYGTMAMSDNGAAAWVAGRDSQAEADADAIANCTARVKEDQPDYLPGWPCRIVARLDAPAPD